MKYLPILFFVFSISLLTSCSKDDVDPQIKNPRVCTELSGSSCNSHNAVISSSASKILTSAELEGIKNANVSITLWFWDGMDWQLLSETTINNGDKNIINVTFTAAGNWPIGDYDIEYLVDVDPQLLSNVSFMVE